MKKKAHNSGATQPPTSRNSFKVSGTRKSNSVPSLWSFDMEVPKLMEKCFQDVVYRLCVPHKFQVFTCASRFYLFCFFGGEWLYIIIHTKALRTTSKVGMASLTAHHALRCWRSEGLLLQSSPSSSTLPAMNHRWTVFKKCKYSVA